MLKKIVKTIVLGILLISAPIFIQADVNINDLGSKVFKLKDVGLWSGYEFGRPGKVATYLEEFFYYVAADWTVTETDAAATEALATAAPTLGGVLLITNVNADDNVVGLQKVGHSFDPQAGTNIWCEVGFQGSEATQSDWLVGLVVTDTTPLANTDGIYFRKDDGDTNIDFETNSGSTASTETAIATFAADTYVVVGFKVTGLTLVEYYVNGVKQGEFNTNITSVPLRVTLHFQDGDTAGAVGAQTASVDYVVCAQSRAYEL